jgi:hypothetical protein
MFIQKKLHSFGSYEQKLSEFGENTKIPTAIKWASAVSESRFPVQGFTSIENILLDC